MLQVEYDAKKGLYKRYTESLKVDDVLSDMAGLVIAFDRDIREQCDVETARLYRKAMRRVLDLLECDGKEGGMAQ